MTFGRRRLSSPTIWRTKISFTADRVRWLVDECVDVALAAELREGGHDVTYMSDVAPRAVDAELIERAHRESRLLLTEDKDFGEVVFRQARPVPGIVLLRIDSARRSLKGTHRGSPVPFAAVAAAIIVNAGPRGQKPRLSQQEQSFAPIGALSYGAGTGP